MKGVLAVQGSQRLFVLQGVRKEGGGARSKQLQVCGELKGEEGREWRDEEERRSELIVIGKNLSHER
eukprot:376725-Hanusia_phi.AAC.1